MYLAFDQSTVLTGWAAGMPGQLPVASGTVILPKCRDNHGRLLAECRKQIDPILEKYNPHVVALEGPFLGKNPKTYGKLVGVQMAMEYFCYERGIRVQEIIIGDWRKPFIGLKQTPKDKRHIKDYLKKLAKEKCESLGLTVGTYDEAEAIGILDYLISWHHPEHSMVSTPLFQERVPA